MDEDGPWKPVRLPDTYSKVFTNRTFPFGSRTFHAFQSWPVLQPVERTANGGRRFQFNPGEGTGDPPGRRQKTPRNPAEIPRLEARCPFFSSTTLEQYGFALSPLCLTKKLRVSGAHQLPVIKNNKSTYQGNFASFCFFEPWLGIPQPMLPSVSWKCRL